MALLFGKTSLYGFRLIRTNFEDAKNLRRLWQIMCFQMCPVMRKPVFKVCKKPAQHQKLVYHMTSQIFSGKGYAINNVMTTHYVTLSAGIRTVMTTSVTTMQFFIEIKFEGDKITFKMSYDKQNLTLVIISY